MSYKIKIPKPCHEDWQAMTPTQKGRFCSSCHKEVVDFTTSGNAKIYSQLHESQGEGFCGRFTKEQLNQSFTSPKNPKFSFFTLLATIGITSVVSSPVKSQEITPSESIQDVLENMPPVCGLVKESDPLLPKNPLVPIAIQQRDSERNQQNPKVDSLPIHKIEGKIRDSLSNEPMIAVTVQLVSNPSVGAISDIDGSFTLKSDENEIQPTDSLIFRSLGYEERIISIKDFQDSESTIFLNESNIVLGGAVLLRGYTEIRPSLWQRFKNLFRNKKKNEQHCSPEEDEEHSHE